MSNLNELTNYRSAFTLVKSLALVSIVLSFLTSAGALIYALRVAERASNTIYIMDNSGQMTSAAKTNLNDPRSREIEYRAHIKRFYTLWYQFDEGNFLENTEAGLYLVGNCGKELKLAYDQEDLYKKLQKFNMRCTVRIDSISLNTSALPVSGSVFGVQTVMRPTGSLERRMDCSFDILDFDRSENNPHGIKLENWKVINSGRIDVVEENGIPVQ